MTPEEQAAKEEFEQLSSLAAHMIHEQAAQILDFALGAVERGAGTTQILGRRSPENPELAAFVVVCSGKYTDSDIANVKNAVMGAAQDVNGGRMTMLRNLDRLNTEGGSENGS